MEENNVIDVEQSNIVPDQSANTQSDNGDLGSQSDSTFGKFRDAKALLDAYNNLQVAFTKKSQQLAELIKSGTSNEQTVDDKPAETPSLSPIYEQSDWHEKLGQFLEKNSQAKSFAKEISSILIEDKELAKKPDSLELAWAKVMTQHYISPDNLTDDIINNYLSSHANIKDKIIKDYLNAIRTNSVVPLIAESKGLNTSVMGKPQFSSLTEAKQYVEALFRK